MRQFVVTAVLFGGIAPAVLGAAIASESFVLSSNGPYSTGPMGGRPAGSDTTTGTSGFTGTWITGTSTIVTTSAGLSSPLDAGQGGSTSLYIAYGAANSQRQINRPIASYTPASTYWFSGIFSAPSGMADGTLARVGWSNYSNTAAGTVPTPSTNPSGIFLGVNGTGSDQVQLVARNTSGVLTPFGVTTSFNSGAGTSNHFAIKLEIGVAANGSPHATEDRVTVYMNPTSASNLGTGVTFQTDAMATGATIDRINLWNGWLNNSQSGVGTLAVQFDELRFGRTVTDVVVPEPASISLAALGSAALLRRRRRGA